MEQMRPELAMFAQYMEHKLKLNDHKGGWEKCTIEDLFNKLRREVDELEVAIKEEPSLNVAFEAADIANFAMMIAWNVMRSMFQGTVQDTEMEPPSRHQVCDECREIPFGNCGNAGCVNCKENQNV